MADLSKVRLNGTTYNLKDAESREWFENLQFIKGYVYNSSGSFYSSDTPMILAKELYDTSPYPYRFWFGNPCLIIINFHDGDNVLNELYFATMPNYQLILRQIGGRKSYISGKPLNSGWDHNTEIYYNGEYESDEVTEEEMMAAINNSAGRLIPYGYCETAADTAAKVVTVLPEPLELVTGLTIAVKFKYTNAIANPTLNVNNLGAIAIKRYGTTAPSTSAASAWNANEVMILVYDGAYWQLANWINTTYSGMTDAEYQAGTSTTNRLISPARLKAAVQLWAPIPENVSAFTNDVGYLTSYTESDPTVPAWAKASTKPAYTAQEVGALPADTVIPTVPTNVSAFTNDAGYLTSYTESDPTVPSWAKQSTKPTYTASEVGALALTGGTVSGFTEFEDSVTIDENLTANYLYINHSSGNGRYILDSGWNDEDGLHIGYFASPGSFAGLYVLGTSSGTTVHLSQLANPESDYDAANKKYVDDSIDAINIPTVPTDVSAFTNDAGYLTSFTETDPTVPAWAKAQSKPTYTASEVGALPDTTVIPTIPQVVQNNTATGQVMFQNAGDLAPKVNDGVGIGRGYINLGRNGESAATQGYISFINATYTGGQTILKPTYSGSSSITVYLPTASGTLALEDKLKTTAGSNNTEYNLIGTATSNTNTSAVNVYNPGSISFAKTTTEGRLTLGSSSLPGKIRLYSNVTNAMGYTDLVSGSTSTNTRTITFPDATGTVALTSDIPSVPNWAMQSSKPSYTFSELTSHPTTINDYGITDTYTKTEVDGLVNGVLHYKGAKANTSALPSSGNTIGDVWHITADGSEWAWDGSEWQELGSTVDLSGYLQTGDIAAWAKASTKPSYTASEVGALPSNTTYVSTFNGQSGAITYIPPVTSVNGQTGAVTLTIPDADDKTWNNYTLDMTNELTSNSISIPWLKSNTSSDKRFRMITASSTPHQYYLAKYDINSYLYSTTPSTNDNSTKVATTAYVDAAIPLIIHTDYDFNNEIYSCDTTYAIISSALNNDRPIFALNNVGNITNIIRYNGPSSISIYFTEIDTDGNIGIEDYILNSSDVLTCSSYYIEHTSSSSTVSAHTHGNITNTGDITTNVAIASGDRLVINDESASKINNSSITFGSSTTQYLANNGTWQNVPSVPSASTTAATDSGTATAGTSTAYARADHVHPSDVYYIQINSTVNWSDVVAARNAGKEIVGYIAGSDGTNWFYNLTNFTTTPGDGTTNNDWMRFSRVYTNNNAPVIQIREWSGASGWSFYGASRETYYVALNTNTLNWGGLVQAITDQRTIIGYIAGSGGETLFYQLTEYKYSTANGTSSSDYVTFSKTLTNGRIHSWTWTGGNNNGSWSSSNGNSRSLSISGNTITLLLNNVAESSITLPVYNGGVS